MLLEVGLVRAHHAIQPGEKLLGAVVGMENDRDVVGSSNGTNVVGTSDGTSDRGFLVGVGDALKEISICAFSIFSLARLALPFQQSMLHHPGTFAG